jgi:hypothetical protein
MRMTPAHSLSEVMNQIDNTANGFILPRGAALLPLVKTTAKLVNLATN